MSSSSLRRNADLLARWSWDRWKSNRHRVLRPQAEAPDEDPGSLVVFYEADGDAMISSLQPPLGKANSYEPMMASPVLMVKASGSYGASSHSPAGLQICSPPLPGLVHADRERR